MGIPKFSPQPASAMMWAILIGIILALLLLAFLKRRLAREIERRQQSEQALQTSESTRREEEEILHLTRAVLRQLNQTLEQRIAQHSIERQQATLRADLEREAKTDLLKRIGHDLRSPLNAIMGYAQLSMMTDSQTSGYSRNIYRSAKQILSMVNDLSEFEGDNPGYCADESPMYIYALLETLAHEGRMLAQGGRNLFEVNIPEHLPPVLVGNSRYLRRVLLNLLDNAAKYTENGTIRLSVTFRAAPEDPESLWLAFTITDSGCGISLAHQDKIFVPFFRPPQSHATEGSGLGLPIVRSLIRQMGGDIQLLSQEGRGTAVSFELPLRIGSEKAMSRQELFDIPRQLPTLVGDGRHIWVIEDNEDICSVLQSDLEKSGFLVRTSKDSLAFIRCLQAGEASPPNLVLTDFLMPGADGDAVRKAVQSHWQGVPVVLLSGTRRSMDPLNTAAQSGFAAVLMKPVNLLELRLTLARLLDLEVVPSGTARPVDAALTADGEKTQTPPLPREVLLRLRELVTLGAASDMLDYADDLARRYPEHNHLALHVRRLAEAGDLDGLCLLVDQN